MGWDTMWNTCEYDAIDRELDRINEERWEYDLPPITRKEWERRECEYMMEKYDYDIYK